MYVKKKLCIIFKNFVDFFNILVFSPMIISLLDYQYSKYTRNNWIIKNFV